MTRDQLKRLKEALDDWPEIQIRDKGFWEEIVARTGPRGGWHILSTHTNKEQKMFAKKMLGTVLASKALVDSLEETHTDIERAVEHLFSGDTQAALRILRGMIEK